MGNTWFTSDLHFDHNNILGHCPDRPWKNAHAMNKGLVKNWNDTVGDDDNVWILGDFRPFDRSLSVEVLRRHVDRLKGNKHLILGNHDEKTAWDYVNSGFTTVHTWFKVEEFNLIHDPAACIVLPEEKWLYGHLHQNVILGSNALNVGVDRWEFKPVSIEQVREHFKNKGK